MLELWKEALDKSKSVGAIFMDLSKAFLRRFSLFIVFKKVD